MRNAENPIFNVRKAGSISLRLGVAVLAAGIALSSDKAQGQTVEVKCDNCNVIQKENHVEVTCKDNNNLGSMGIGFASGLALGVGIGSLTARAAIRRSKI